MDLDQLWEAIFSENAARVHRAWNDLNSDERTSVHELLERIVVDAERVEAQRIAARFALDAVEAPPGAFGNGETAAFVLPDGALDFARSLALDTGRHLKATFGQLSASLKRDGTLVTQSDIESDRKLSEAILSRYPTHGILSEERDKTFHGQKWCWVIDPIDGTTNFTWGFPAWGVLIALLYKGQPVLGVADFPMTDEHFYAARGEGAWLNGHLIHTAWVDDAKRENLDILKTKLFACCTRTLQYGRPDIPMKIRIAGTTGYDLALVAKGACVGSLDLRSHVWDIAALWPLVGEAGGRIKTNLSTELFPLTPHTDCATLTFSILSSCSKSMMAYLEHRLADRFVRRT